MHVADAKPKILVVDSDEIVARDVQAQLMSKGYEVAGSATRGEQAIILAGELRPDMVLMDAQLSGAVDGIAAAQAIRTQFSLPVVFLMSNADEETLSRTRLAEPYGYIRKPISASVLGTVVELALNRHKAEAKLWQSEERLRMVLLGSRDGIWDRDLIKNEVYYSPRWFEMLGYADAELPSTNDLWQRLMHPDDLDRVTQFVAQVHAGEASNYEIEFRLRHGAGHYVPILTRGFVVRDANGKGIRVGGTNTDLTARKQAEAIRWENEQRFRTIFEAEPECVKVLGPTGDLLEMNVAGLTMLEAGSVEEARSHGLINFILPEYRADFRALHQRVMGGEPGLLEFRITGRRGTQRWLETHAAPMRDAEGRVTMSLDVTRDITERKQAAEQMRRSEKNLAITLQSIGDAVIATDVAGLITRMNATAEHLTGWSFADATGRPLPEVFCIVNAHTRVTSIKPLLRVLESGKVLGPIEPAALLARDGKEYRITDSAAPIRNPDGQTVGVVLVFSDVTEEYRIRQALAHTTEMLERTGEVAKVGGWELDVRTMKLFWSLETFRIHEIDPPWHLNSSMASTFLSQRPVRSSAPRYKPQSIMGRPTILNCKK
ncbi:MAG: PAS domain S-box protein [Aeromicrobium sp.]|nr:PAS domain S-box protein [Burkholderiales bacterium]